MQLFGKKSRLQIEQLPSGKDRLPPGQYLTKKWPVLSAEDVPSALPADWKFTVRGLVEQPLALTWAEFLALPRITITTDIHCVTTWSRYDNAWEGVSIREILRRVKPLSNAHYVMAHSWTGYTSNIPLTDLDDDDVLIALKHDGLDLEAEHGGPVRLVVPKLYFYKSAKWLDGLEFMEQDRPGFWEKLGYHNHADPWQEERYW
jgi:DMSO/TMAO reductase YedYZ molybdopterin-dependent catalytic subunit